jgi:hypothetical protein
LAPGNGSVLTWPPPPQKLAAHSNTWIGDKAVKSYQVSALHGEQPRSPCSVGSSPAALTTKKRDVPRRTRVGRDLHSAFLARFVLDNRLDAIQAAKAWTGAEAFLRVASNGFDPASGKGFAFPHVTLGVRAGRSKKYHANHREAGDDVGLADLPVSRAPERGEAPRGVTMAKRLSMEAPCFSEGRLHELRASTRFVESVDGPLRLADIEFTGDAVPGAVVEVRAYEDSRGRNCLPRGPTRRSRRKSRRAAPPGSTGSCSPRARVNRRRVRCGSARRCGAPR